RQWRQVEGEGLDALNLGELALHQRLQLDRGTLALGPRLQQHARDAVLRTVDAVKRKAQVGLRKLLEHLIELLAVEIEIVDIGVFRRLENREHDALVFLWGKLLGRVQVKEADEAKHRHCEHQGDRL